MNIQTRTKLERIIALYTNGARKSAKALLRSLTRVQLVQLLVEGTSLEGYMFSRNWHHEFQRWVLLTMEGYEDA